VNETVEINGKNVCEDFILDLALNVLVALDERGNVIRDTHAASS
jgi:hypothetical protein